MAGENRIAKFLADAQKEKRQQEDQRERGAAIVAVIDPHVVSLIAEARERKWDDAQLARAISWFVYLCRKQAYVQ